MKNKTQFIKTYVHYDSIDALLSRMDKVIATTKYITQLDSTKDKKVEYVDTFIKVKEDGTFVLVIKLKVTNK